MTEQQNLDSNDDRRHEFRAGTVTADDQEIVDDQGHRFERGRVSSQDEAEQK